MESWGRAPVLTDPLAPTNGSQDSEDGKRGKLGNLGHLGKRGKDEGVIS